MKPVYKAITSLLSRKNIYIIKGLVYLGRKPLISLNRFDYVRIATLELFAHEIQSKGIHGHVAELGVYQGGFAKYINRLFPDRKFYLFDTFSGFDKRDESEEEKLRPGYTTQNFTDTSIQDVLSKMKYPDNCIFRKGYFPSTFKGLEEEVFCFVSIDADLYEPILSGLQKFYPRLVSQGVIMVHDFNNAQYAGCRMAVEQFCRENDISYLPLPDAGGTAVIRKS